MPHFGQHYFKFREAMWNLIWDCKDCKRDECPEWCCEMVSCTMDDLYDEVAERFRRIGREEGMRPPTE